MSTSYTQQPIASASEVVKALSQMTTEQLKSSAYLSKGANDAANASQSMMNSADDKANIHTYVMIASAVLGSLAFALGSLGAASAVGFLVDMPTASLPEIGRNVATAVVGTAAAGVAMYQGVLEGQIKTNGATGQALIKEVGQTNSTLNAQRASDKALGEAEAAVVSASRVVSTNS